MHGDRRFAGTGTESPIGDCSKMSNLSIDELKALLASLPSETRAGIEADLRKSRRTEAEAAVESYAQANALAMATLENVARELEAFADLPNQITATVAVAGSNRYVIDLTRLAAGVDDERGKKPVYLYPGSDGWTYQPAPRNTGRRFYKVA